MPVSIIAASKVGLQEHKVHGGLRVVLTEPLSGCGSVKRKPTL
ncbi:MAG: hypothetical protein ACK4RZ_05950 [Paracoccaceae bacterium]